MNKTFDALFEEFYTTVCRLYIERTGTKIMSTEEYNKMRKHFEVLIPIYNRISTEDSLTLENILLRKDTERTLSETANINENPPGLELSEQKLLTYTPNTKVDEPDEPDEIGDKLVSDANTKASELLQLFISNNWSFVEEEVKKGKDDKDSHSNEFMSDSDSKYGQSSISDNSNGDVTDSFGIRDNYFDDLYKDSSYGEYSYGEYFA